MLPLRCCLFCLFPTARLSESERIEKLYRPSLFRSRAKNLPPQLQGLSPGPELKPSVAPELRAPGSGVPGASGPDVFMLGEGQAYFNFMDTYITSSVLDTRSLELKLPDLFNFG